MVRNALLTLLLISFGQSAIASDLKKFTANGADFAYVEMGRGDPIIFVHGGLQDYRTWGGHLSKFSGRYRAIAYSRRNNFPNKVSPEGMPEGAADAHGEELAALTKALGLSKVRVVAHSSGGHAALFFASAHPEMVDSLALNEPPATGVLIRTPGGAEVLKAFGASIASGRQALKVGNYGVGIPLFVNAVSGAGAYERLRRGQKMNLDNAASYRADAITKRPRAVFTCEMAKKITFPTLLTDGETSPKFFYQVADQLAACLPNVKRAVIAGSSHTVPAEQPEAFDT